MELAKREVIAETDSNLFRWFQSPTKLFPGTPRRTRRLGAQLRLHREAFVRARYPETCSTNGVLLPRREGRASIPQSSLDGEASVFFSLCSRFSCGARRPLRVSGLIH